MNKCYIRRKGTNRWLRLKGFEKGEKDRVYSFKSNYDIVTEVEHYHMENSLDESDVYEVTQDKKEIVTVVVTMHLEPYFSGEIK